MPGLDTNTKLLLHGNGVDGSFEILDDGNTGHIITQYATASLTTAQKKFGSTSLFIDGNSDYLTIPDSTDWDFGSGDFTVEFWLRGSTSGSPIQLGNSGNNPLFGLLGGGNVRLFLSSDDATWDIASAVSIGTLPGATWAHYAVTRNGTTFRTFKNGTQISTFSSSATIFRDSEQINIASTNGGGGSFLDGNMEEVRITKGVSRYNSNFTPQSSEHISDANTKLLLHMNTQDVSGDGGSGAYHIPNFVGTAQLDTAQKKFGSASFFFDGDSDYLTFPDSSDWDILEDNTSDWTIDFWQRSSSFASTQILIGQTVDINNRWAIFTNTSSEIEFISVSGGSTDLTFSGGSLSTNTQHHIALIKVNADFALYIDGTRVAIDSISVLFTLANALIFGKRNIGASELYYGGHIDEARVQNSNYFNADPTSSAPITFPTQEYSLFATPQPPTSLTSTTFDKNQIDLEWIAPVDTGDGAITGYKIERESPTGNGFSTIVADTGNTNLTYSDSSVFAGTQYNYRVSAINSGGPGNPSNENSDTTDPGIAPVLSSVIISKNQNDLTWTIPVGYGTITGYKIERENPVSDGFTTLIADTGTSDLNYSDTSVYEATQFNYRVTGLADIDSDLSNESLSTTPNIMDSETSLLLHANNIDGSIIFTDSSTFNKTPTIIGNVQIDTAQSKFGGSSIDFRHDGSGRALLYSDSSEFDLDDEDFAIDIWIRIESNIGTNQQYICSKWGTIESQESFLFFIDNNAGLDLIFRMERAGLSVKIGQGVSLSWNHNQWYHVAVVRNGDNVTTSRNGVAIDTQTFTGSVRNTSSKLILGNFDITATAFFDGWQDEFRFSKGSHRFPPNFTPLSVEYASTVGGIQIQFDRILGRLVKIDTSKNIVFDYLTGEVYRKIV